MSTSSQADDDADSTRPVRIFAVRCDLDHYRKEEAQQGRPPLEQSVLAFRGAECGRRDDSDTDWNPFTYSWTLALACAVGVDKPGLSAIAVYATFSVHGLRFEYDDGTHQSIGCFPPPPIPGQREDTAQASPPTRRFAFEPSATQGIARIRVRAGWWLDAIQFELRDGRSTEMVGNLEGGEYRVFEPPSGRTIVGLQGSVQDWIRSLGILYDVPDRAAGEAVENVEIVWPPRTFIKGDFGFLPQTTPGTGQDHQSWQQDNDATSRARPQAEHDTKRPLDAGEDTTIVKVDISIDGTVVPYLHPSSTSAFGMTASSGGESLSIRQAYLDEGTVTDIVKTHLGLATEEEAQCVDVGVTVEDAEGRTAFLDKYFWRAFADPVRIFAPRDEKKLRPESVDASGAAAVEGAGGAVAAPPAPPSTESIVAICATVLGSDENWLWNDYTANTYTFTIALASCMGERPAMTAISIATTDNGVSGLKFEYDDGTSQSIGHAFAGAHDPDHIHRFDLEPKTDGRIAKIVARVGAWVDAIQFVFQGGQTTDWVGNTAGGERYELVPPAGGAIVGLHGTGDEKVLLTFGICCSALEEDGVDSLGLRLHGEDDAEDRVMTVWPAVAFPRRNLPDNRPAIFATPRGPRIYAAPGSVIKSIKVCKGEHFDVRDIELNRVATQQGRGRGRGVTELVLDKSAVMEALDDLMDLGEDKDDDDEDGGGEPIWVKVLASNLCTADLKDYLSEGYAQPQRIPARREGDADAGSIGAADTVVALRTPAVGFEVKWKETCDPGAHSWSVAFANVVARQPGLRAITVIAIKMIHGLRFEYTDGTAQCIGNPSPPPHPDLTTRRLDLDPETDGGIAHIVVRAGGWIDAIQFVLESGKATEMLGDVTGGEMYVLKAPGGRRIVGLHGSIETDWIRSIGIYHDVEPQDQLADHDAPVQLGRSYVDFDEPRRALTQFYSSAEGALILGAEDDSVELMSFTIDGDRGAHLLTSDKVDALPRRTVGEGASARKAILLEVNTVKHIVAEKLKEHRKAQPTVIADERVRGTLVSVLAFDRAGRMAELADFFRQAVRRPERILVQREGGQQDPELGIMTMKGPIWGHGHHADASDVQSWSLVFASCVGTRPPLIAITIVGTDKVRGLRFEYEDGCVQQVGDVVVPPSSSPLAAHRFEFEPTKKDTIIRLAIRAGCFVNSVHFVLASGQSARFVATAEWGDFSMFVAPPGRRVVGLHGTWARDGFHSLGLLYDA